MTLIFGIAVFLAGVVLTRIGIPDAAGVPPRLLRGFFGEHVYPLVCTGFVLLGSSALVVALIHHA